MGPKRAPESLCPGPNRSQGARNMTAPSVVIRHSGRSGFRPFGTSCLCLASSAQSAEESKTMATRRELLGVTVLAGASAFALWPRRQTAHAATTFPIAHSDAAWRAILSPAAYYISRKQGTEVPFCSPLDRETRRGIYHCAGCALP